MMRVSINSELLRWARERSGLGVKVLEGKFAKLGLWEADEVKSTLSQVEAFARTVHVPVGCLVLSAPPKETLPVPDCRTIASQAVSSPSQNLLVMLHACQERQAWYREFAKAAEQPALVFVGGATSDMRLEVVAGHMQDSPGWTYCRCAG